MSDDFASLFQQSESQGDSRGPARLRPGQVVTGRVVQIGKDSIFVDIGSATEARIDRREFEAPKQGLKIQVGDSVRASVVSASDVEGVTLTVALGKGKGQRVDEGALLSARDARLPVEGTISKAVKGGVEVNVMGTRAFCPASQLGSEYSGDLAQLEGQHLQFVILEVKNGGRDVIVSHRALVAEERARQAQERIASLEVEQDYEGTVVSTQKYGAFIDLGGGVEGLVHISELTRGRVQRVEDVVNVGDVVQVRLLAITPAEKAGEAPRLQLSLKALSQDDNPTPERGEILEATVDRIGSAGVFVETPKGAGLVPLRELGIPRQADPRRAFPVGSKTRVVLLANDAKRGLSFSIARVAGVEERQNFRDFAKSQSSGSEGGSLGSFGELLRQQLNLPEPAPEVHTEAEPRVAAKQEPRVDKPASAAPSAPAAAAPKAPPAQPAASPTAPAAKPKTKPAKFPVKVPQASAKGPAPAERTRIYQEPQAERSAQGMKAAESKKRADSAVIRGRRRPGQAQALKDLERRGDKS